MTDHRRLRALAFLQVSLLASCAVLVLVGILSGSAVSGHQPVPTNVNGVRWEQDRVLRGHWDLDDPPPSWMQDAIKDGAWSTAFDGARTPHFSFPGTTSLGKIYYQAYGQFDYNCGLGDLGCANKFNGSGGDDSWRVTFEARPGLRQPHRSVV